MKRENYINWDEFFMGVCELASKRSKDPSTRNGCCIIDPKTNHIISVGYNGLPKGLDDNGSNEYDYWKKPDKYEFVVHAETNAIFNASISLEGSVLYLYSDKGYYPCSRCASAIVQNGIIEVVLHHAIKENTETYNWDYTLHMFKKAGIKIRIMYEK